MKLSRRNFLRTIGIVGGAALLNDQAQAAEPAPDEHKVFLPMVNNGGAGDYVKLIERVVPQGHIGPSIPFYDFAQYSKYVIEFTGRMNRSVIWFPSLMINDDNYAEHYDQFFSFDKREIDPQIAQLDDTELEHGHFEFPRSSLWVGLDHPYTLKIEITNKPELYKSVAATGSFFMGAAAPLLMYSFRFTGVYRSTAPIEKMILYPNYPTGFFNSNSVAALYGIR